MKEFFAGIGIQISLLIAGFAGGLVSINKDKKLSIWGKITVIISGGFIATYITPVFFLIFKFEDERAKYGIAFVIGYMGLKAIELVVSKLTKKVNENGNN